jgi:polyferredoxin
VTRFSKPFYESLPVLYGIAGAALLWLSYRGRDSWWSALCALGGFLAMVGGLAVWMRRRDYRATSVDYRRRGRPPGETSE